MVAIEGDEHRHIEESGEHQAVTACGNNDVDFRRPGIGTSRAPGSRADRSLERAVRACSDHVLGDRLHSTSVGHGLSRIWVAHASRSATGESSFRARGRDARHRALVWDVSTVGRATHPQKEPIHQSRAGRHDAVPGHALDTRARAARRAATMAADNPVRCSGERPWRVTESTRASARQAIALASVIRMGGSRSPVVISVVERDAMAGANVDEEIANTACIVGDCGRRRVEGPWVTPVGVESHRICRSTGREDRRLVVSWDSLSDQTASAECNP